MNKEQFNKLDTGDIVKHKFTDGKPFIVTSNYGNRVTAVQSVDLTNHVEWELVYKCSCKRNTEVEKKALSHPESIVLNNVVLMAQQSLDPDSYDMFCKAHDRLVDNRHLQNKKLDQ